MKCTKLYKDKKKLMAYKKRNRDRYYHSGDYSEKLGKKLRYTDEEDLIVMQSEETDREIAKAFNRSIRSVQHRRHRLKYRKVQNSLWFNNKS